MDRQGWPEDRGSPWPNLCGGGRAWGHGKHYRGGGCFLSQGTSSSTDAWSYTSMLGTTTDELPDLANDTEAQYEHQHSHPDLPMPEKATVPLFHTHT